MVRLCSIVYILENVILTEKTFGSSVVNVFACQGGSYSFSPPLCRPTNADVTEPVNWIYLWKRNFHDVSTYHSHRLSNKFIWYKQYISFSFPTWLRILTCTINYSFGWVENERYDWSRQCHIFRIEINHNIPQWTKIIHLIPSPNFRNNQNPTFTKKRT